MVQPKKETKKLKLQSPAFEDGQEIPPQYTGEGKDISPPLEWSNIPPGTRELALICEDPDAPQPEPWVHWLAYHIPAATTRLPEGIQSQPRLDVPIRLKQGINSFDRIGYNGPLPPQGHGWHRYYFKLYALDTLVSVPPRPDKETLLRAMNGHVIAESQIMGRYKRD